MMLSRGKEQTQRNILVEVIAELLVDALSVSLAEPASEILSDTVKAKALVDALTNTLAEMEA